MPETVIERKLYDSSGKPPQQVKKSKINLVTKQTEMFADSAWTSFLHCSLKSGLLIISLDSWDHDEAHLVLNVALKE